MPKSILPGSDSRGGLTFVEVMIVVATLAILASLPDPFKYSASAMPPRAEKNVASPSP